MDKEPKKSKQQGNTKRQARRKEQILHELRQPAQGGLTLGPKPGMADMQLQQAGAAEPAMHQKLMAQAQGMTADQTSVKDKRRRGAVLDKNAIGSPDALGSLTPKAKTAGSTEGEDANLDRQYERALKKKGEEAKESEQQAQEDDAEKLMLWQARYERAKSAYGDTVSQMDEREQVYRGTRVIPKGENTNFNTQVKKASHVRNFVYELIETQVNSNIPAPKVTTMREENAPLAKAIEDSIKSDMERLPFMQMNDEQERTVPIQGGSFFLVEWDNSLKTHSTVGDLSVTLIHPKNVIPQGGIYNLKFADYVFIRIPRTKEYIQKRYGVDVESESEAEQGIETVEAGRPSEEKVTQVSCYYKNRDGIWLFSWVNDVILEDLDDYQARQLEVCAKCGQEKPADIDECDCGSRRFQKRAASEEVLAFDITETKMKDDGTGNMVPVEAVKAKKGTHIPYYKPNRFPVILRKNVSAFGQLLGDSDVDKIRDQQNAHNKFGTKIEEKLLKGGSYVLLPKGYNIPKDDRELKVIEYQNPNDAAMIKAVTVQPDISYDAMERNTAYEEARSTLGITDSYQGKPDPTADSGRAKQIQVEQSSGRLESKRVMKNAAYAELYKLMFQFKLAYTDEPRPYVSELGNGQKEYGTFSRYDFLKKDDAGEFYYDDNFLFSIDPSGSLSQNRQELWEETRRNLHEGAFGNPQDAGTLLLFWGMMESLSYPMAKQIKQQLQEQMQQQQQQAKMQSQQSAQAQAQQQIMPQGAGDIDALLQGLAG